MKNKEIIFNEFNELNEYLKSPFRGWNNLIQIIKADSIELNKDIETISYKTNYYEMSIMFEGDINYTIEDQKNSISSFHMFFCAPGKLRKWSKNGAWEGFYCSFKIDIFLEIKDFFESNNLINFFNNTSDLVINVDKKHAESIVELFRLLHLKYEEKKSNKLLANYLQLIFMEVIDLPEITRLFDNSRDSLSEKTITQKFLEYAQSNFSWKNNSQLIADKLFISQKHLEKTIKNSLNIPPNKLLKQNLIRKAKSYLIHTDKSVDEIARELEFESSSQFVKFFKRNELISPNHFRRLSKKGN